MEKLKHISIMVIVMFCFSILNPAFATAPTFSMLSKGSYTAFGKEYTSLKVAMHKFRNKIFTDFMKLDYCEYDPETKVAKIRSNSGNEFIVKELNNIDADEFFDKLFCVKNQRDLENVLKEYAGNFYYENIKIGSKSKNKEIKFSCIPNKIENGSVESYTLIDETGYVRGIISVKEMDKEQKKTSIREVEAVNLLTGLIKKISDTIKGITYSTIRQTENSLKIPNQKGEILAIINMKGITNDQINKLKNYYNKYILNKSSKNKTVQKALKFLKKKVNDIRELNELNDQIKNKYGESGLRTINKIIEETGFSKKYVFKKLKNNKISKKQLNKVYKQMKIIAYNEVSSFMDFSNETTYKDCFKKAISNVTKNTNVTKNKKSAIDLFYKNFFKL